MSSFPYLPILKITSNQNALGILLSEGRTGHCKGVTLELSTLVK